MNPRRERFIEHYLRTGQGAESARLAGYAEPAAQSAYQVLSSMEVTEAIAERQADILASSELTPEWTVARFMALASECLRDNPPVALAALRELSRIQGQYETRVSIAVVSERSRQAALDAGLDPDEVEREALKLLEPPS